MAFGQDEININSSGERKVDPAYRIAITPKIIDTTINTAIVNYPLLSLKFETQATLEQIEPAAIKTVEHLDPLYNTYVKLGVGTELMPLGEVYFDSKRSRKFMYGAHLKHLSSFGNISHYAPAQFDRTRFGVYGGINEKRYELRGDVHYNNQGLHYYGAPDTLGLLKDSIAQRYSDFGIGAKFTSHVKDSAKLNYSVGLDYNNYLSKKPEREEDIDWRAKENFFGIRSSFWYKLGKETYAADLNILYNGYKYGLPDSSWTSLDSGLVLNNTVISLKPSITTYLQDNRFKAKIGVDFTVDAHTKTKAYVYPMAEIKYSMFNDIFIPYLGVRGGLKQTTFKSLTQINEFMLPNVELRNEKTPIDFYGGIKGTLSKRIYFNAGISFAYVRDKALFVTDTLHSIGNKFDVIYDTMTVTTIEASIGYQLKEKLKIEAIGRYYSYAALNNSYAWNMPRMQFIVRGTYNLFEKVIFNLDVNLEEGRKALVYGPGEDITEESGQYILDLGFIADANLGIEYRYNKRISAFVQLNNVASQGYMRWFNAPVQRFQFLGGVTFRF
ncbi:MAG: hypothetical protein A3D92_14280 [Bacteroidetes bacterium RIFCSPHIGHO2_02_FULL_44_7]|nr:MAG: hypothetical protein A3D92_14280 [Bacteroidetes bacterium RIFCSPHIGHO2_02_FULL_44_7]